MSKEAEIAHLISFVRVSLDIMEAQATDPARQDEILTALKPMLSAAMRRGVPDRMSDKPPRGLGYGQLGRQEIGTNGKPLARSDGEPLKYTTPDDAMIVASLPWFKGNMSEAIRAHYPEIAEDAEKIKVHARRIREHRKEIEDFIGSDHPWETYANWLGDLPRE